MRKLIKLDDLILDAGTQVRAIISEATVDEYAEAYKDKSKFPPIDVFADGNRYLLADGFHRVHAATRAGLKSMEAEIHSGTRADCIRFALGTNVRHGLRRSNQDKHRAVEIALREFPKLSNRAIAELCSVDESLAREIRPKQEIRCGNPAPEKQETTCGIPAPEIRIGRDGKEYTIPPPPQVIPPPPLAKAATKKEKDPEVRDKTDWVIPVSRLPLWNRSQEVQDMLTTISKIKCLLEKAEESKDVLYAEVQFGTAVPLLEQVYSLVKRALPYAVCPTCQGRASEQCVFCKGRGIISDFMWDRVPREVKEIRFKNR